MKCFAAFIAGSVISPVVLSVWAWRTSEDTPAKDKIRKSWAEVVDSAKKRRDTSHPTKIDPETYVSSVTYEARKEQAVVDWIIANWNGSTPESAWRLFDALQMGLGDRLQVDFEGGVRLIKA